MFATGHSADKTRLFFSSKRQIGKISRPFVPCPSRTGDTFIVRDFSKQNILGPYFPPFSGFMLIDYIDSESLRKRFSLIDFPIWIFCVSESIWAGKSFYFGDPMVIRARVKFHILSFAFDMVILLLLISVYERE